MIDLKGRVCERTPTIGIDNSINKELLRHFDKKKIQCKRQKPETLITICGVFYWIVH